MSYPVPPPSYNPTKAAQEYGATSGPAGPSTSAQDPLLAQHGAPRNEWSAEGEDGDIPEDFKIGMTVSQSSQDVRHAFIAKVYGVLFCQILGTTIIGAVMSTAEISQWVQEHNGFMMIPMFGAIGVMIWLFFVAHSHPLNVILLGVFTVLEAITIGSVVSYFNQAIVLQALVITTFVFVGLTLFTFQSKYDFSNMGSYLFAALLVFFLTGIVGMFIPFSRGVDIAMAGGGCLIFSLYIVYDTHRLLKTLHVDDWVLACVSLYLDIVNLFLQILRLLSDIQDR